MSYARRKSYWVPQQGWTLRTRRLIMVATEVRRACNGFYDTPLQTGSALIVAGPEHTQARVHWLPLLYRGKLVFAVWYVRNRRGETSVPRWNEIFQRLDEK